MDVLRDSVQLDLWGMTLNRHKGSISLNDSEVAAIEFLGLDSISPSGENLPPSLLLDGDNTITVSNPGTAGI